MAKRVVDVLLPVALDQAYSYRVPDELTLAPGDIVSVQLGARVATGVVWAQNPNPNPRLDNRMKEVEEKLDLPPLKPELRKFIDWVAGYTLTARGTVLRMALRMGEHLGPARERVGVRLAGAAPKRMTAARGRVLAFLADGLARGKSDVAEGAGVSPGVIDGLVDEGSLESLVLPPDPVARAPNSLQPACDRRWRLDLDHEIDGAHVNAQFERRGGDESRKAASLEAIFNLDALLARQRPVVRSCEHFAGQLVDGGRESFGEAAAVDEDQCGSMFANQLDQPRVDCGPDRHAARARRWAALQFRFAKPRHVLDGDLDTQLDGPPHAGIDNRDGPELRDLRSSGRKLVVDLPFGGALSVGESLPTD